MHSYSCNGTPAQAWTWTKNASNAGWSLKNPQSGRCLDVAGDGTAMDQALNDARVDLVVLDLMLPGEDGLSLCRRLRTTSNVPILMLTAKAEEIDRIIGLEIGDGTAQVSKLVISRNLLGRAFAP